MRPKKREMHKLLYTEKVNPELLLLSPVFYRFNTTLGALSPLIAYILKRRVSNLTNERRLPIQSQFV